MSETVSVLLNLNELSLIRFYLVQVIVRRAARKSDEDVAHIISSILRIAANDISELAERGAGDSERNLIQKILTQVDNLLQIAKVTNSW